MGGDEGGRGEVLLLRPRDLEWRSITVRHRSKSPTSPATRLQSSHALHSSSLGQSPKLAPPQDRYLQAPSPLALSFPSLSFLPPLPFPFPLHSHSSAVHSGAAKLCYLFYPSHSLACSASCHLTHHLLMGLLPTYPPKPTHNGVLYTRSSHTRCLLSPLPLPSYPTPYTPLHNLAKATRTLKSLYTLTCNECPLIVTSVYLPRPRPSLRHHALVCRDAEIHTHTYTHNLLTVMMVMRVMVTVMVIMTMMMKKKSTKYLP